MLNKDDSITIDEILKEKLEDKLDLNSISNEIYGVWIGNRFYKMPEEITYDELEGLYGEEYLSLYGIKPPNIEDKYL